MGIKRRYNSCLVGSAPSFVAILSNLATTVVNGVVTPVAKGNVTITATYEGVSASCEISVVMVALPSATPVTLPFASTFAIASLLDVQVITLPQLTKEFRQAAK